MCNWTMAWDLLNSVDMRDIQIRNQLKNVFYNKTYEYGIICRWNGRKLIYMVYR